MIINTKGVIMGRVTAKMRQVMDWSAAIWAGAISGVIYLILNMILTSAYTGSPWLPVRLIASIMMGQGVLPPPASFDAVIFIIAFVLHICLSIGYACLIAGILHRWGLLVGFLGGAAIGAGIYLINFYSVSYFFPWFFPLRSWIVLLSHVLFGGLAGGIYELLEREEYEKVKS
jgi:hypothetical protein